MYRQIFLASLATLLAALSGCSSKFVPDTETTCDPPVAFQQQFIAESLDSVFRGMDFSRLRGKLVEIEVIGPYIDGDVEDYIRSLVQLELAKSGALSETAFADRDPDYKANVMVRYGGVNDVVKWAILYEWRQRDYVFHIQVAVFSMEGDDYFVQSGKGASEITVARNFYLIFFPIPLPTEYSRIKSASPFSKTVRSYDAAKRGFGDSDLRRSRASVPQRVR